MLHSQYKGYFIGLYFYVSALMCCILQDSISKDCLIATRYLKNRWTQLTVLLMQRSEKISLNLSVPL